MAAQNRTTLQATLEALAAVVTLAELKTAFTNFVDSMVMNRDVQSEVTIASTGTRNLSFTGYDAIKVNTAYDVTLNLQNIEDGDIKFLYISKTAGVAVTFTGGVDQSADTTYVNTLTDVVYMVTKKIFTSVIIAPLSLTFDHSALSTDIATLEGRVGTLNSLILNIGVWDMDSENIVYVTHGITASKIRSVYARIENDDADAWYNLERSGSVTILATQIMLTKTPSGTFDNTDFNNSSKNRGTILVWYID